MRIGMDWRAIKFDWNRARAFLVTAEEGSLSAAARALGQAQPTLGRQVAALEEELGVALFERLGRGLLLTAAGRELLAHVREMGAAAGRVSLAASGQARQVEGPIRIAASEADAAFLLPPVLADLRLRQPGIVPTLVVSNDLSDLRRREADIALRAVRPTEPELMARKIRDGRARLYAAESYLAAHGPFDSPKAATRADYIGIAEDEGFLRGLRRRGLDVPAERFRILSRNHLAHWELVKAGLGIGVMIEEVGDRTAGVARALPWLDPFVFPTWLVAHRELATSARVRTVYDHLAAALGRRAPD